MRKRTPHYGRYVGELVELPSGSFTKPTTGVVCVVEWSGMDNNRVFVVPEEKWVKGKTTEEYIAEGVKPYGVVAEWCRTVAKSPA